jgi:hypothetical protein
MTALVRYQLVDFANSSRWLWPAIGFLLGLIGLTALALGPAPSAYGLIAPLLALMAAWCGWVVGSAVAPGQWQIAMVAVGGRERVLLARWFAALLCAAPAFGCALIGAELGRQHAAHASGPWTLGVLAHLVATVFGVSLGLLLAAGLGERGGRPIPQAESTPQSVLISIACSLVALLLYAGALGAVAFTLAAGGVAAAALTRD